MPMRRTRISHLLSLINHNKLTFTHAIGVSLFLFLHSSFFALSCSFSFSLFFFLPFFSIPLSLFHLFVYWCVMMMWIGPADDGHTLSPLGDLTAIALEEGVDLKEREIFRFFVFSFDLLFDFLSIDLYIYFYFYLFQIHFCEWISDEYFLFLAHEWMYLREGVGYGRRGRGSVYVFGVGNGGQRSDNCNYDAYTNSPFTISGPLSLSLSLSLLWFYLICDVMWCDVMWCDVMWCDVMWCVFEN